MKIKFLFVVIISQLVSVLISAQNLTTSAPPLAVSGPVARGYKLGPGDEVTIKVFGEPQFDFVARVNEEGNIQIPAFAQTIAAKCRTEDDLRTDVTALMGKYLRSPQLSLYVSASNSRPPATIYGEVNTPKQVELHRKATLLEFISIASGVKEEAGGTIQVFRTTPPMCGEGGEDSNWKADASDPTAVPSRLYNLSDLKLGKEDSNPIIFPGDVIYVHRALPIYVTGEVVAPQGIYLKDGGLSLTEAIAKVSGLRHEAKTKDIKIFRLKPHSDAHSQDREVLNANYDLIKSGKEKDPLLQPNDIVEVGLAKDSMTTTILKFALGAGKATILAGSNSIGYKVLY